MGRSAIVRRCYTVIIVVALLSPLMSQLDVNQFDPYIYQPINRVPASYEPATNTDTIVEIARDDATNASERLPGVVYTLATYANPIRIEHNMSVDIEHTCEETPCPYARPIPVLRTDSVAWRNTPLCTKSHGIYRETRPGTWYYD
eukprot:PhM_4_TR17389/c2_g1_i1/m.33019